MGKINFFNNKQCLSRNPTFFRVGLKIFIDQTLRNYGSCNSMLEKVLIRRFQTSDLDACRSLWRELVEWHQMLYEDNSIGGEHPETCFDKHLSRVGEKLLWVAVLDSKVVGFTGLLLNENECEGELEPLIVSQTYRCQGIGTKLINVVIAEAKRIGLKSLSIKPVMRNLRALRLFNKQGFRSIGQIELYIDFSEKCAKKNLDLFSPSFNF